VYNIFNALFPDVAEWALNNQIKRDPTGKITYEYKLIDDFDREVCRFTGPLNYLHNWYRRLRGRDYPDAPTPDPSRQYNRVAHRESDSVNVQQKLDWQKPTEFEPHNHMLHIMVSKPYFEFH